MERLHIASWGSEASPALLLVHGFMSCNLQWAPNRPALQQHFRLLAAELWGHGDSPTPRDAGRYAVAAYVSELEAARVRLGIDRWLVCGQSFGAGIAMRYALAHPEAVRGLIVTNSRSALNDVSGDAGWTARIWCGKEAVAKAVGTGLRGRPRAFQTVDVAPDGALVVEHGDPARRFHVRTSLHEGSVFAVVSAG